MKYRQAAPNDVAAIAGLHAESWRRHYRGATWIRTSTVTSSLIGWPSGPIGGQDLRQAGTPSSPISMATSRALLM
jgi:hypothetical protein